MWINVAGLEWCNVYRQLSLRHWFSWRASEMQSPLLQDFWIKWQIIVKLPEAVWQRVVNSFKLACFVHLYTLEAVLKGLWDTWQQFKDVDLHLFCAVICVQQIYFIWGFAEAKQVGCIMWRCCAESRSDLKKISLAAVILTEKELLC